MTGRRPAAIDAGAWVLIGVALADLLWRQLTRVPLPELALGAAWAPIWSLAAAASGAATVAVRARTSREGDRRRAGLALFLALLAAGSVLQVRLGARLQSDGFYYYAFARSIWFDGDVNLDNDYRLLGLDDAQHQHLFTPTPTGHAQTTWAIGPALLWSPFVAAGHGAAHWLRARDGTTAVDGTSFPYRQAVCLAGLTYGLAGVWLCFRIARQRFSGSLSAAAAVTTAAGSFVLWYLVREPTMSHPVSMAAVALVVLGWLRMTPDASWRRWMLLGLACGLMMTVRWQNAIVALLPAATLAAGVWRAGTPARRRALVAAAGFGVAALAAFLPQMVAWKSIYGTWIARAPIAPQMFWSHPQIADLLFSSRNGLFATSPALYLAAIGLVLLWRHDRALSAGALLVFALMCWTNGAVEDWYGGAGYGGRRFDSLIPFFTAGLAATGSWLHEAVSRRPPRAAIAVLATLVLWNVLLMGAQRDGAYRLGQPVSFADVGAAQAGVLHDWAGHPASWPLNLAYAARNGVAPARYDVLRPYRFLGDPTRPYGRIDVGTDDDAHVVDGWHAAERAGDVTFRWASGDATLLVPLDHPAPLEVQVRLQPFTVDGAPAQTVAIGINGVDRAPLPLGPDWQTIAIPTAAHEWRAGVNRVRLRFGRATRPADVGGSGDTRALAAAVDYLRVAITGAAGGSAR
jgi:hypothetical protein